MLTCGDNVEAPIHTWLKRFEGSETERLEEAEVLVEPGEARRFEKHDVDFVEIAVHDDVSRIFVVPADCVPQLEAEWMVMQPDVLQDDPTWGWEPVRERGLFIGSEELTRIKFRPGDPTTLCKVASVGEAVEIENFAETPLQVIARHWPQS